MFPLVFQKSEIQRACSIHQTGFHSKQKSFTVKTSTFSRCFSFCFSWVTLFHFILFFLFLSADYSANSSLFLPHGCASLFSCVQLSWVELSWVHCCVFVSSLISLLGEANVAKTDERDNAINIPLCQPLRVMLERRVRHRKKTKQNKERKKVRPRMKSSIGGRSRERFTIQVNEPIKWLTYSLFTSVVSYFSLT